MKYKKDLGFAAIKRDKLIDKSLEKIFSRSFEANRKLFGRKPKKFDIIVCDTEKEFKNQAKYYYFKWATATVLRDNNLITRSPDFVEKIGRWKKSDFQNLMIHEMNHVFWMDFYGLTKPCWLLEGLACYIGRNFLLSKKDLLMLIVKHNVDHRILDYRYLERNFKEGHYPRYPVWAGFTDFISKKYSERNLIETMDRYIKNPSLSNYKRSFEDVFGKSERYIFKEFLEYIKS